MVFCMFTRPGTYEHLAENGPTPEPLGHPFRASPAGQAELTSSNKPKSLLRLATENSNVEKMEPWWIVMVYYGQMKNMVI